MKNNRVNKCLEQTSKYRRDIRILGGCRLNEGNRSTHKQSIEIQRERTY